MSEENAKRHLDLRKKFFKSRLPLSAVHHELRFISHKKVEKKTLRAPVSKTQIQGREGWRHEM